MILADLIKGHKTATTLPPANANPAKIAKVDPVLAVFEPRLAGLATLALAGNETTDIFGTGDRNHKPHPNGGRDLPHYCQAGDCWCSEKLPGRDYPNGCIRANCEHYLGGDHAKEG